MKSVCVGIYILIWANLNVLSFKFLIDWSIWFYDGFIRWVKMNSSNEERWFFLYVCITVFHPITYTMHNLNAKFEVFFEVAVGLRTLFTIRANYLEILYIWSDSIVYLYNVNPRAEKLTKKYVLKFILMDTTSIF